MSDVSKAQKRIASIAGFREEWQRLIDQRMVNPSAEERAAVQAYHDEVLDDLASLYDLDVSAAEQRLGWGMRLATAFGAVVLAIAVVLAVDQFWFSIATGAQVTIAIAGPLLLVTLAEIMRAAGSARYYLSITTALAVVAFGLNLWILGTVYNRAFSQEALLLFGLFTAALAHRHGTMLIGALGLAALSAWLGGRLATIDGAYLYTVFSHRQDTLLLSGGVVLLIGAMPPETVRSLAAAWRLAGTVVIGYALLALSFEGTSLLPLADREAAVLYQVAGFVFASLLIWLALARGWRETVWAAYVLMFLLIIGRLVDWAWVSLPKYAFFALLGGFAIAAIWVMRLIRASGRTRRNERTVSS